LEELKSNPDLLFNGPLETGLRAIMILDAAFPSSLDLPQLTWLDHFVVHTSELGGPASLHPDLPQSTGELLVRRKLVEAGLTLLRRMHMIEIVAASDGFKYVATENASALIDSMRSSYAGALRERASWLIQQFVALGEKRFGAEVNTRVGRWTAEFQGEIDRWRE
jgi:hypothetical protein